MSLKSTFGKAEDGPGFLLWKASNLLQRMHAERLEELDITPTQFSLLTCLVYLHQSGPVSASRIVAHSGMDKMSVSDLVKTLLGKKLIRRKANPEDGRSFLLEPTTLGESRTNSAVRKVEALDAEFFRCVENFAAFHRALLTLAASGPR